MPAVHKLTIAYDNNIEKVQYGVATTSYTEIANGGSIPVVGMNEIYIKVTPKTGYSVDSVTSSYPIKADGNNAWIWNYTNSSVLDDDTVTITSKQGASTVSKSYDLSTSSKWSALSDGEHTVQIVAKGTGYRDSAKSTSVTVTKGGATLINFTIGSTSYQAEEGMTWQQWVDSSYNTSNGVFFISGGYLKWTNGSVYGPTATSSSAKLKATDTPQANGVYTAKVGGGGSQ